MLRVFFEWHQVNDSSEVNKVQRSNIEDRKVSQAIQKVKGKRSRFADFNVLNELLSIWVE